MKTKFIILVLPFLISACSSTGSQPEQAATPPPAAAPVAPPAPDFSKTVIKTTDLGKSTYMLEGEGGNITVAVSKGGILMVDGQFAPLHDKILAAVQAISKKPLLYLLNTHYHRDHVGGNESFTKDGAKVLAHVNVKNRLAEGTTNGLTGAKTPPATGAALPAETYEKNHKVEFKGRTAEIKHPLNAHTDGDSYVYFKDANVLSTGDTFTWGRYPNIDFAYGGNIKGMILAAETYMKLANGKTKIVPGHGPLADKAKLVEYHKMLTTARDRMTKLVAEGKSEQEVIALKPFADLDKTWAPTDLASTNFIRVVYNSLAPKK